MTALNLFLLFSNFALIIAVFILFVKMQRPPKEDPRLSRGLQLLQSKIAVLEDLSDRTEAQVHQLNALMEQKSKEVQNKIFQAEKQIHSIDHSMAKSMEVAKIFEDRIPHSEIIERQNTKKYVQAARLAHQGLGIEEIARQIDLPLGELELIVKINKEQLIYEESALPAWIDEELPETDKDPLKQLGNELRNMSTAHSQMQSTHNLTREEMESFGFPPIQPAVPVAPKAFKSSVIVKPDIRKFEFPKVKVEDNLS